MNLKSQFLSLSALLALGMATSAWGEVVSPTVNVTNGVYSVNMPKPLEKKDKVMATWQVPKGVNAFKVYDDGGLNGAFSSTYCDSYSCAEQLTLVPPEGFFLHLSGSLVSAQYKNGNGDKAYFNVYDGVTGGILINPIGSSDNLLAWTSPDHEMILEFYTTNGYSGDNQAGLDLTIDVAMNIGTGGPGAYSFTDGVDYLELHASATTSKVNQTTTLTSPAGTMMYIAFDDVLANGDSVVVLNGESSSTDTLLKKTNATNNDVVYIPSNKATICVNTNDDGLNNILRAYARVLTKNVAQTANGADFYTNEATGYTVAKISDVQTGTVSIPTAVNVDAIVYDRVFTAGTAGTIVLPFSLPAGATTNAKFYYLKKIVQVTGECRWKATMTWIRAKNADALPEANTPYAVIIPEGTELWFKLNGNRTTIQTGKLAEQPDVNGNWIFKGTYEYKAWETESDGIGLDYAIAKTAGEGYKAGDFVKIGSGVTSAPMRAYISKANSGVTLQPVGNARPLAQSEISSIENLPESIDVEFVDEDEKTTAIGRLNTVTGAIKIDRWFDLKGRSTNHKPTTKGAFFNKKGIAK